MAETLTLTAENRQQTATVWPLTRQELEREIALHDRIFAGLVLVLTVLISTFPVTNSDVFMRLATGRLIASGQFVFGADPYCYTTQGQYWVHHGWLFDVLLYGLYRVAGGVGLSLLRTAVALAVAAMVLRARTQTRVHFAGVVATGLTVLVMSQRLLLRSEMMSFLLLAANVLLLFGYWHEQTRLRPAGQPAASGKAVWLLVPLWWLWANLDAWFFLGPLTAAGMLAGEYVRDWLAQGSYRRDALPPAARKQVVFVLVAGLVACLINPYFWRAYTQLPAAIASEALEVLQARESLGRIGLSPFERAFFVREEQYWFRPLGLSLAEWSFYAMVLGTLGTFVLLVNASWQEAGPGFPLHRLVLWLGFFLLAAWQARNAGLFAVASGLVMSWNAAEWLEFRARSRVPLRRKEVVRGQLARIAFLALVLVLAAMAVIPVQDPTAVIPGLEAPLGMIHARGALGWGLLSDPSLEELGHHLARWRSADRLPGRGFNFVLGYADYLAWLDPEGKTFMDTRLELHSRQTASDYVELRQGLVRQARGEAEYRLPELLQKYDISYVIVPSGYRTTLEGRRAALALAFALVMRGDEWVQLDYCDGRTFVLAWRKSPHWSTLHKLTFQAHREAFREVRYPPPARAPALGEQVSPAAHWLQLHVPRRPLRLDESLWYFGRHQVQHSQVQAEVLPASLFYPGRCLGMSLSGLAMPPAPLLKDLSEAWLLLAVRAARRAVAEQPSSGEAWLQLYRAYKALYQTESQAYRFPNPMRESQLLTAARRASQLRADAGADLDHMPDLELARAYYRLGYLDLAVSHLQQALDVLRARRPTDMPPERFEAQLKEIERLVLGESLERIQQTLRERRAVYNRQVQLIPPGDYLARAQLALQLRLADQALSDLQSSVALIRDLRLPAEQNRLRTSWQLLVQLYVQLGFALEARELLGAPGVAQALGPFDYHYQGSLAYAATGDYELALRFLDQVEELQRGTAVMQSLRGTEMQILGGNREPPGVSLAGITLLYQGFQAAADRADLVCWQGLLALEAGQLERAREAFASAVLRINPQSAYLVLAGRYYYQLTGALPGQNQR